MFHKTFDWPNNNIAMIKINNSNFIFVELDQSNQFISTLHGYNTSLIGLKFWIIVHVLALVKYCESPSILCQIKLNIALICVDCNQTADNFL